MIAGLSFQLFLYNNNKKEADEMFFFRGALFWKSYLFILRRYYIINVSIIDNSAEEYMRR